jgi:hypothetical protein
MDTAQTDAIFLHSKDGKRIPFTPSEKGIYKYILPAHQNITDLWNLLSSTSKPQETTLIDTVEDPSKYIPSERYNRHSWRDGSKIKSDVPVVRNFRMS